MPKISLSARLEGKSDKRQMKLSFETKENSTPEQKIVQQSSPVMLESKKGRESPNNRSPLQSQGTTKDTAIEILDDDSEIPSPTKDNKKASKEGSTVQFENSTSDLDSMENNVLTKPRSTVTLKEMKVDSKDKDVSNQTFNSVMKSNEKPQSLMDSKETVDVRVENNATINERKNEDPGSLLSYWKSMSEPSVSNFKRKKTLGAKDLADKEILFEILDKMEGALSHGLTDFEVSPSPYHPHCSPHRTPTTSPNKASDSFQQEDLSEANELGVERMSKDKIESVMDKDLPLLEPVETTKQPLKPIVIDLEEEEEEDKQIKKFKASEAKQEESQHSEFGEDMDDYSEVMLDAIKNMETCYYSTKEVIQQLFLIFERSKENTIDS
jgi:hypothetical protein